MLGHFRPVCVNRIGMPHRIEIRGGEQCWTLFITGPRIREWGFHCPQGWRHWRDYTKPGSYGQVGRGCGEME